MRWFKLGMVLVVVVIALLSSCVTEAQAAPEWQREGCCYGVKYNGVITEVAPTSLKGVYLVTADVDEVGSYTLKTTRLFKVNKKIVARGSVCNGYRTLTRFD